MREYGEMSEGDALKIGQRGIEENVNYPKTIVNYLKMHSKLN
jgi:hypothetical protein